MILKTLFIVLLVGSISAVHWLYTGENLGFHTLHQQLFFIPLVLASFWFGSRAGFWTAVAVSFLYGPVMLSRHHGGMHLTVFTQIALYLFVAFLMGWLSDRQRRQRQQLIKNERLTALARAASTVGIEIGDIVKDVDSIYRNSGGLKNDRADEEFQVQINRLRRVIEGLKQFNASLDQPSLSNDLNDILRHSFAQFKAEAADKGVRMEVLPSPGQCPSTVPVEQVSRIFDALVGNAIDFSRRGQSILLRSYVGAEEEWILEVADAGPGVAKEVEEQLFTAFFTTKPDGYGLSLSSGRKLLRDLGGDLTYAPGENGGAVFRMHIPKQATVTITRQ